MAAQYLSIGSHMRSKPNFIISSVAVGLFTDLFLHGIIVPILPFILRGRLHLVGSQIESRSSMLLVIYASSTIVFSAPSGWLASKCHSRRLPFVFGSLLIFTATTLLTFGQSLGILVVAMSLQGMSAAIARSIGFSMALESLCKDRIGQVFGMINSFSMIAQLIAPILGGVLYDKLGIVAVFAVTLGVSTIDLIMRLLIIETRQLTDCDGYETLENNSSGAEEPENRVHMAEEDVLLPKSGEEAYHIPGDIGCLTQAMPVLCCFRNPRFLVALLSSVAQAMTISMFDATIPVEADRLFHYSPLQVGYLFMALLAPYVTSGFFFGWAVDRYGTKVIATVGHGFLVPCLALLGLPSQNFAAIHTQVVLLCCILSLNGLGLSMISSPGVVEATLVLQRYEAANPALLRRHNLYVSLYSLYSCFLFLGLAVGPLLGTTLENYLGYGGLGIIFAVMSGVSGLSCWRFME